MPVPLGPLPADGDKKGDTRPLLVGRHLALATLELVQGHPKMLELADAAAGTDPAALACPSPSRRSRGGNPFERGDDGLQGSGVLHVSATSGVGGLDDLGDAGGGLLPTRVPRRQARMGGSSPGSRTKSVSPVAGNPSVRVGACAGVGRPQPVRERKIPKPGGSGKVRRLGIPTVTDRVVQECYCGVWVKVAASLARSRVSVLSLRAFCGRRISTCRCCRVRG